MERIEFYFRSLDEKINWGRFKGYTWNDVMRCNGSYLIWCIDNIPQFTISENFLRDLQQLYPNFIIPTKILAHLKLDDEIIDMEECDESYNNLQKIDDSDSVDNSTYEKYAGSWAQEVEGYSDDDIDTLFDGDPDAYWNID